MRVVHVDIHQPDGGGFRLKLLKWGPGPGPRRSARKRALAEGGSIVL